MKSLLLIALLCIAFSCKKHSVDPLPGYPGTIRYQLYTDKDFSANQDSIFLSVFIQNNESEVLWDSALAPMKMNEIPSLLNKIVVQKTIPQTNELLKVGFSYAIKNTGHSRFIDSCNPHQALKILDFNFQ